ncbi:MAG: IS66 family transposase [Rhodopirellula sp.]|nr:IS66 family transposase [Rhodopirellula sp.]
MSQDDLQLPNDMEQLKALIAGQAVAIAERDDAIAEREASLAERESVLAQHAATITQHETVIDSLHETIEQQLRKLEGLHQQLARLLRKQYGPQKERIDPDQLTLFSSAELESLVAELQQGVTDSVSTDDGSDDDVGAASDGEVSDRKKQRKGHGRRPLPDHLPREEVTHELTAEERTCPCCGKLRKEIGSEVSEQLEFVPASLKVIQHHRKKYACDACEENVAIAAKPPQPIPKGLPGPGLLAHTVLSKYGDYLPLYRQEDILSRSGIIIRRSTLCDWVASTADLLQPLYDLMCDRVRSSHVIHTDDTGIKMLDIGQCRNCKFWAYAGDKDNQYAVYEFSLTREGQEPSRFLEGFKGYLQADAFSGYDQVYATGKVIEVACMAHARRYWWESIETDSRRAHEAISYIARLYALEAQFDQAKLEGDARRDARQQYAIPILNTFEAWLRKEQHRVLPKSPIGKAFTYTLNQWAALCRYTEDGALSIDNNLAERLMKPPAIGRKNFLFVGSETGGDRAAILLSVIASAKLCEVEPWAWLNHLFRELPLRLATADPDKPPDLTDLLPDNWLKSHPQHRWQIDEIRQKERARSRQQKINKRKRR